MPRHQKAPLRGLSVDERHALEQIARAGRERADRVARARILLAVADGARFTEAARVAGRRSGDAVARLVARWNDEGMASLEARALGAEKRVASGSSPHSTANHGIPPVSESQSTDSSSTNGRLARNGRIIRSADINATLRQAFEIEGTLAVALVDLESGMVLGAVEAEHQVGFDLDVAAAGNTEVVRAKMATIRELGLSSGIEDILITLTDQYHVIRPLGSDPGVFLYMVLDRDGAKLGLARRGLGQVEAGLVL